MEPTIRKNNAPYRGAPESFGHSNFTVQLYHDIRALAWLLDGDDAERMGHTDDIHDNMCSLADGSESSTLTADELAATLNSSTKEYSAYRPYSDIRAKVNQLDARIQHLRRTML